MGWYLYLLECKDGSRYTGITTDVKRRMKEHKNGKGSKYVASRRFSRLLASVKCRDRSEASKLEWKLKKMPAKSKLQFIRLLQRP